MKNKDLTAIKNLLVVRLKPVFENTTMEIKFSDLGFTEESWENLRESAKERILSEYLSTYQPEKENFWQVDDWS